MVQLEMGTWGIVFAVVLGAGCAEEQDLPDVGSTRLAATVASYTDSACSTAVVEGLSRQIADEVNCMAPGILTTIDEGGGIAFNYDHVLPYVTPEAKQGMRAAVSARGGTLQISSLYRTVAQQYLLYRWWQEGRCGITAAATPGNSNHESGRAVDVSNYDEWIGALGNHGWAHDVPGDPVHFDHTGSPDLRGMDVHAFQRLWNRNHPEDAIAEDGDYGPQTAARLAESPAGGFAVGACPQPPGEGWDAVARGRSAPDEMAPGERAEAWVELENTGTTTWSPATTFLGTTSPRDRESAFFDDETWAGPNRPTAVDAETAPGAIGRFSFMLHAPAVNESTSFVETFGLLEENLTWFGPEDVTLEVSVVAANGGSQGQDPNGEGPGGDDGQGLGGGCDVAPHGAPGSLLTLLLLLAISRSRPGACSLPAQRRRKRNEHTRPPHPADDPRTITRRCLLH